MTVNAHAARALLGAERGKEALRRQLAEAMALLEEVCDSKSWTRENAEAWGERYAALVEEVG